MIGHQVGDDHRHGGGFACAGPGPDADRAQPGIDYASLLG
jgi:hypothetical protein